MPALEDKIYAEPADVVACYRLLLGRSPDPSGLKNFSDLVSGRGITTIELAGYFMASPEFIGIQQATKAAAEITERVRMKDFPFEMDTAPRWNGINREIAQTRAYESHITRELLRMPLKNKVFVDCGANIGYFTMVACHMGAEVWSFEPNPRNISFLMRNLELNGYSAQVYPYAVADREQIMVYNSIEGNGQLEPYNGRMLGPGQDIVRTVTLDNVLQGVSVDVIKLDIEGAEWLALQGAKRIIQHRPVMFTEFSPSSIKSVSHISPLDFLNCLINLGYKIEVVERDGLATYAPEELIGVAFRSHGAFADLKLSPSD